MAEGAAGRGRFQTTRWSLIFAAQKQEPDRGVLNTICELYWYPIYVYIRSRGHDEADAKDLTQAFFVQFLEKNAVHAADRERGKFRSFIVGSLNNFLSHQRERNLAQKRGGNVPHVSFDSATAERLYLLEPADGSTPEKMFDRRWALQLLDTAVEQLREEYSRTEKRKLLFEVLVPLLESGDEASYREAGQKLGKTGGAARTAASRLRDRFGKRLRGLIALTVPSPDLVEDEVRYLMKALSNR